MTSLCLDHNLLRRLGLHLHRRMDQVVHNLAALAVAGLLDLLELHLGLLVRFLLGLLVPAGVLFGRNSVSMQLHGEKTRG